MIWLAAEYGKGSCLTAQCTCARSWLGCTFPVQREPVAHMFLYPAASSTRFYRCQAPDVSTHPVQSPTKSSRRRLVHSALAVDGIYIALSGRKRFCTRNLHPTSLHRDLASPCQLHLMHLQSLSQSMSHATALLSTKQALVHTLVRTETVRNCAVPPKPQHFAQRLWA